MPIPEQKLPWLTSPLRSSVGTLRLAGALVGTPGIRSDSMRILGNYALVLLTAGKGYYLDANDRSADLEPGDAILVFPELAHAYGPARASEWNQSYAVFEGPAFDLLRAKGILSPKRPIWKLSPVDYWNGHLKDVFQGPASLNESSSLRSVGRFLGLLTEMAAADRESQSGDHDAWLEESLRLLSEPQSGSWLSPQEVAPRVGLSYESFRKRFASETGEAPGQHQKRRRIERACAAIYHDTGSFKQIAEALGFCDAYHFSRFFSQVMGESPSEYRKRARGS